MVASGGESKTMEVDSAFAGLNLCENVGPDAMSKAIAADASAAYAALPLATRLRLAVSPRPWRSTRLRWPQPLQECWPRRDVQGERG